MVQAQLDFFLKTRNYVGGHWRPNQILGQNFYEVAKYFGHKNALVKPLELNGVSATGFLCEDKKLCWRPLEANSDFGPKFLWSGQVFWPEKCPGQASRAQWCEHNWISLWRQEIMLEAIGGQFRFWAKIFMRRPSILAIKMPWSSL